MCCFPSRTFSNIRSEWISRESNPAVFALKCSPIAFWCRERFAIILISRLSSPSSSSCHVVPYWIYSRSPQRNIDMYRWIRTQMSNKVPTYQSAPNTKFRITVVILVLIVKSSMNNFKNTFTFIRLIIL